MIFYWITYAFMALAAIAALINSWNLRKLNRRLLDDYDDLFMATESWHEELTEYRDSVNSEVFMLDCGSWYLVFRKGRNDIIPLLRIDYDRNDPEDKEYKRIFAEERVESLNEKP